DYRGNPVSAGSFGVPSALYLAGADPPRLSHYNSVMSLSFARLPRLISSNPRPPSRTNSTRLFSSARLGGIRGTAYERGFAIFQTRRTVHVPDRRWEFETDLRVGILGLRFSRGLFGRSFRGKLELHIPNDDVGPFFQDTFSRSFS